ncbi:MAG: ABC transporter permease [Jatrophihabitantaceae bacterium]
MLIYTIRRLISSFLVLLVASFIVFMFAASSYDPLKPFRARNPQPSPAFFAAKSHLYHLDQPLLTRYWNWLVHMVGFTSNPPFLRFNFGSDVNGASVADSLGGRLQITVRMVVGAIILAALLAIVLGVISGVRRDKPFDAVATLFTFLLLALPTFWFAAVLKDAAIRLNQGLNLTTWRIGTAGTESFGAPPTNGFFSFNQDEFLHIILPVLSLGLLTASGWIRYQRASTIDVLEADYMRLARAKGVRNRTVIRRHGLRNALIPLVTVMAIDIGALFGGAIITEKVYVWHGMGEYLNTAIGAEDTYAVAGWVMVSAIFVVLFNLLADLLYAVLDPRIRLA